MTQAQTLVESIKYTRNMTLGYWKLLKEKDIYKEFEINGTKLNSAYWIMGHLAVTQNYMLLRSTGAEHVKITWARAFGLGGSMPEEKDRPSVEEIFAIIKEVDERSFAHAASLTDEQLLLPNTGSMKFGDGSYKAMLLHTAWHEGNHCGHLGWLCKLHGIKTI